MWKGLTALALLMFVALVGLRLASYGRHGHVTEGDFRPGDGQRLVVVVHGFSRAGEKIRNVVDSIWAELDHPDILVPSYDCGAIWPQCDLYHLAGELEALIASRDQRQHYREIVLVGHSIGALLVRKAFVYGHGFSEDRRGSAIKSRWVKRVRRIVLLAGLNRGWSLDTRPRDTNPLYYEGLRGGLWLLRVVNLGHFLTDALRGSPFVANLRLQWMQLMRGPAVPLVVQLLGDTDELVTADDNKDLGVSRRFVFIPVPGSSHLGVLDFSDPRVGERRRAAFVDALTTNGGSLRARYPDPTSQKEDATIKQVVFVMHGIRDNGTWATALTEKLEAAYRRAHGDALPGLMTIMPSYGYFSMFEFLVLADRQRNVRWFMDRYTEAVARFPNAAIDFIGHSNGTYVLASALSHYGALKVRRAAFAGSVVPSAFPWTDYIRMGRIEAIKNYVARSDWVVGIFPHFFETVGRSDIGGAGFNGFLDGEARRRQVAYVPGGHHAALEAPYVDSIVAFIVADEQVPLPLEARQHWLVSVFSKMSWLVFPALVGAILWVGWMIERSLAPRLRRRTPRPLRFLVGSACWIAYGGLVVQLLKTL